MPKIWTKTITKDHWLRGELPREGVRGATLRTLTQPDKREGEGGPGKQRNRAGHAAIF